MDESIIKYGLFLGWSTMFVTSCLEIANKDTVFKIIKKQGMRLYLTAWAHTTVNATIYGPIVYYWVGDNIIDYSNKHSYLKSVINTNSLLVIHSIGYWLVHIMMHNKRFFFMHRFHHKFSTHVSPVIAMAVSPYEYFFAYMLPFIIGSYIIVPNNIELVIAAGIVSICNLIIHSPSLELYSYLIPESLVTPIKHLTHHELMNTHFAAPTYDLDFIYGLFRRRDKGLDAGRQALEEKLRCISSPKSIKI